MFEDADVISCYTRADALADGALVDVTATAKEAGFTLPVAMTQAVWLDCVAWGESEQTRKPKACQDEAGRLWDVLGMAAHAARRAKAQGAGGRVAFEVLRVPADGGGLKARLVELVLHIGPGDTAAPVLTIMQPHED